MWQAKKMGQNLKNCKIWIQGKMNWNVKVHYIDATWKIIDKTKDCQRGLTYKSAWLYFVLNIAKVT